MVHLEVSGRCQLNCPYCYVPRQQGQELSTDRWKSIITDLAGYGVFQVTLGGGEPTLRDDLKPLALHVRRSGMNLCMTTNGIDLPRLKSDLLCLFSQVNVSYHAAAGRDGLVKALAHLRDCGTPAGVNVLLTRAYGAELADIAAIADAFGAELLLLSAKDVRDAIPPGRVFAQAKKLHERGIRVAVDGLSCSGVLADFCLQKVRFCTVDPAGHVMPCSFVRKPLGNLVEKPFGEIWRSRGRQIPCPYA